MDSPQTPCPGRYHSRQTKLPRPPSRGARTLPNPFRFNHSMRSRDPAKARLLVSARLDRHLHAALRRYLARIPWAPLLPTRRGPWPAAEALFMGAGEQRLPSDFPDAAPRLRFVQHLFAGLDGFPFERFNSRVRVAGNVGAYAVPVAEQAALLILALSKNLLPNLRGLRRGRLRPVPQSEDLSGRVALLLGYGHVARELGRRLRGFGMEIHGLSRSGGAKPGVARMFAARQLSRAVSTADVVVECRPLTQLTRGSIDRRILRAMRTDAIFVIAARAATVDEEALYAHLQSHPLFRAGTDVWWHEDLASGRLGQDRRFLRLPNFLGTPHSGGFSPAMELTTLELAYALAAENLARFFESTTPRHVVSRGEYTS